MIEELRVDKAMMATSRSSATSQCQREEEYGQTEGCQNLSQGYSEGIVEESEKIKTRCAYKRRGNVRMRELQVTVCV